jgi:hypothetical protein
MNYTLLFEILKKVVNDGLSSVMIISKIKSQFYPTEKT